MTRSKVGKCVINYCFKNTQKKAEGPDASFLRDKRPGRKGGRGRGLGLGKTQCGLPSAPLRFPSSQGYFNKCSRNRKHPGEYTTPVAQSSLSTELLEGLGNFIHTGSLGLCRVQQLREIRAVINWPGVPPGGVEEYTCVLETLHFLKNHY